MTPIIGILGGGQLGLMLLQAAIDWNLRVHILDPDPEAPCRTLCTEFMQGSLTDYDTVYRFGQGVDVLTIEIERVNVEALEALEREGKRVFPQPSVIRVIQDKRQQKQFYQHHNLPTADFILTENRADVARVALERPDFFPAFHKLGRDGYDGRGVQRIATIADVDKAFDAPGVLERAVDFDKELAVIVARNERGDVQTFPTVEMVFHPELNLVDYLFAPAQLPDAINQQAQDIARQTADALGIVGLLAVELFLDKQGSILLNEVAPRPHNSGHHTMRANVTSQFEQHWRAILNYPLGDTSSYQPAAMVNLLGEDGHTGPAVYEGLETLLAMTGVFPFFYGKALTKPFRKMGHVTVMDSSLDALREKVERVKAGIRVVSA
ncbi:5-(carboxyamino)imidazole ribonucleotide synthase [Spirosoma utsteinense]|uniref:N5-carboxyaminoimidazole ribonucleotide synthase n=1 Tax=Spirosoma utsteinense TaxID=2585773 RepID=A0ABR6W0B2_9BACT|nr:5-(carboxyamino)imidazole ribonucleotide synthase [Spirosoma utsteinense]MBC3786597.1 5-(carboxyamino)imidazole ribonucleotide synthase [Spirosoma utsteinense]MBC3789975.1 5-(carboxyamino)imidazole ribonucleotide synthase [Spirosoma utsteinense]